MFHPFIFIAALRFMRNFPQAPTRANIAKVLRDCGWHVIYYDSDGRDAYGILEMLGCRRQALLVDSFAYQSSFIKVIAVSSSLSISRMKICLFHECGHVVLRHHFSSVSGLEEETADLFAQYCAHWFRRYQPFLQACLYISAVVVPFLCGAILLNAIP